MIFNSLNNEIGQLTFCRSILPVGQFKIPRYASSFRIDSNQFGGTIMVSIIEDIPPKLLSFEKLPTEGV